MPDGVRFVIADRSHDDGIRALLRERPMGGDVTLSLQTEPSYFDAAEIDGEHHTIVAIEHGKIICVGGVSVRPRYLNGRAARVGYLGRLRLAASHEGRFDVLRRGYAMFRDLLPTLRIEACFTSIADDNTRARQFLERGLKGMPRYRPAGELVTLAFQTAKLSALHRGLPRPVRHALARNPVSIIGGFPGSIDGAAALLERFSPALQFSPQWTPDKIKNVPPADHFRFLIDGHAPVGCAAFWDQRAFKQTVVTGYSRRIRLLRPFINAAALIGFGVPLPAANCVLSQAFVSHLALPIEHPERLVRLLQPLSELARNAGVAVLVISLDANDPRLPLLKRCVRPFIYRTRLYTVHWPDETTPFVPDGRLLYPEAALL